MIHFVTLLTGELLGFALGPASRAWPCLLGGTVLLFLFCYGWQKRVPRVIWILLTGCILAARVNSSYRNTVEEAILRRTNAPPVRLTVEDACRVRLSPGGTRNCTFPSQLGSVPVNVVLPLHPHSPLPQIGEVWSCLGTLSPHIDPLHPIKRKTFWVRRPEDARRSAPAPSFFSTVSYARIRRHLSPYIGLGLTWCPEIADLNRAILLGERTTIPPDLRRVFETAGTIHVFAISGLHVVVVAQLFAGLCAWLGITVRTRGLVLLPLLALYVMVTGARPSAIRAALMTACQLMAPLFGRKPNLRQAWIWTAMTVYALTPERLFDIGCTLSFVVMLGIALWLDWRDQFRPIIGEGSSFAAALKRHGFSFRTRNRICGFFNGLGVSFAAWIASVPLMAHFFDRVTYAGLIANLAVIFCSALTVRFGLIGLLASGFCLPLAACFNNLSALATRVMTLASEYAAQLPFASCAINDWHLGHTLVWYAAWLLLFRGLREILPLKHQAAKAWWLDN